MAPIAILRTALADYSAAVRALVDAPSPIDIERAADTSLDVLEASCALVSAPRASDVARLLGVMRSVGCLGTAEAAALDAALARIEADELREAP